MHSRFLRASRHDISVDDVSIFDDDIDDGHGHGVGDGESCLRHPQALPLEAGVVDGL